MRQTKPPHNKQTARVSLAFLIASAITLGMLILAITLVAQSYRGMEQAKVTAAAATARQLALSVDDRINAITQPPATALALLRHDPLTQSSTLEQRRQRLPVIADVLTSSDIVSAVYAGYDNGDFFLFRKIRSSGSLQFPDAPATSRYLLQSLEYQGNLREGIWQFYNSDLELLERRSLPDYDYDPRQRPWYQAARAGDSLQLSAPYVFFTTQETGLTLSQRAASIPGTVLGIDVTVTDLGSQLAELKQTAGSRLAIVSASGELLADADGNTEPDAVIRQVLEPGTNREIRRFHQQGRDWYGMAEQLGTLPDEALSVVVAIPSDELLADVWAALARQTAIAGAIALLLLILGWFMGRQVGKPLERLTDRVSSLSRFRFDTPIRSESHIREASELSIALDDMARTIRSFQNIATVLNRGQDLNQLLRDILDQIITIVSQERGAIYLYSSHEQKLDLAVNRGLELPASLPAINQAADDNEIIRQLRNHISGHPVFAILRNRRKKLIGALIIEMEVGDHTHLSDDLIVFVDEIAGSAAVAIETRELIESQQALLDGFIRLVASAIDAKSPYTGGHCERVPKLAQMITEVAEQASEGPFADFRMNEDERYEFHLAAWLHDCGKITSPEYVVDKAVKLETIYNRIHEIRARFEILHRDAEVRYLQACLNGEDPTQAARYRDEAQAKLQADFGFLANANVGSESMSDEDVARIRQIGAQTWQRHFSDRLGLSGDEQQALAGSPEAALPATEPLLADKPWHIRTWGDRVPPVQRDDPRNLWGFDMKLPEYAYNRGELHNLTIQYGTLTEEERFRINEHIVQTICMLDALPLPDRLARVPRLAGTHHERMDGKGYPFGLSGEDMSIPEKIMAVADIFEALTAVDRPYKQGKTLSEALNIMDNMTRQGHIDRDVFLLFVRSGTYRRYGDQHLKAEQIDTVDESLFMKP
ncbi:HD domain-containing phosphohydrolase [Marinobacter nauticus]|uniref:HD domain-containing phosphohydrolase n=1 Tax=Marinobacter nauticus TaxID=2743 RepID=UPI001C99D82A|nr:HD domain-containing phosphohydrolase [Marinobacter nauticus]MBY5962382.1 phosphodiesterase [Marinobacter nauticus]